MSQVIWLRRAELDLVKIVHYFDGLDEIDVGRKLVENIADRVSILETNPGAGPIEKLTSDRREMFRFLVEGNYKILYTAAPGFIKIYTVFDTRQNPELLVDALNEE